MKPTRQDILGEVLALLETLVRDWDYGQPIDAGTRLFADLGFESLDAVVLGTALQERYQQAMPFAELLADVGQRPVPELTIGELCGFIETHVGAVVEEA